MTTRRKVTQDIREKIVELCKNEAKSHEFRSKQIPVSIMGSWG